MIFVNYSGRVSCVLGRWRSWRRDGVLYSDSAISARTGAGGWLGLVFPALIINYFGSVARPEPSRKPIENPFFNLVPEWAALPLVGMATIATITASQA
jgi:KUP system potassium uptake protein